MHAAFVTSFHASRTSLSLSVIVTSAQKFDIDIEIVLP